MVTAQRMLAVVSLFEPHPAAIFLDREDHYEPDSDLKRALISAANSAG